MKEAVKEKKAKDSSTSLKIGLFNFNTPLNVFLKKICHDTIESLILHKNLYIEGCENKCSLILLKNKLVKSDIIDSKKFINDKSKLDSVFILDLKRIIQIDTEEKQEVYFLIISYLNEGSISNLAKLIIKFETSDEFKIFTYFLEKQKNLVFQQFFEDSIPILLPFYYQFHFFLQKLNSHGDENSRIILITNQYILNIEYQFNDPKKGDASLHDYDYKLSKPKWALSIAAFDEMQLIGRDKKKKKLNYIIIKIKINQKENKDFVYSNKLPYKNKSSVEFIFQEEKICRLFIYQIRRIYYKITTKKTIKITENL